MPIVVITYHPELYVATIMIVNYSYIANVQSTPVIVITVKNNQTEFSSRNETVWKVSTYSVML